MKPMLAGEYDEKHVKFPVLASPKLDGVRGLVHEGCLLSRSLKPIPNKFTYKTYSGEAFEGIDGELIVGSPTDPLCYNNTVSAVMRHAGEPDATFFVFDLHNTDLGYSSRRDVLQRRLESSGLAVTLHEDRRIETSDGLLAYEAECLEDGYEGLILRHPDSLYKFGRSTSREGHLLKLKRFLDSEAEIIGFEELMHNGNAATKNELGRTKRSSSKDGLVPLDSLGALIVRDVVTGVEFDIGTGFSMELRKQIWDNRDSFLGKLVKYKYFPIGVKDAPRHPVWLGLRDERDL